MSRDLLLIPNVGAEAGAEPRAPGPARARAEVARLWRLLFASDAHLAGGGEPEPWPRALAPQPEAAVFAWLDAPGAATAWLNDEPAQRQARAAGRALTGPPPAIVRRVHDKAFALRAAQQEGLEPRSLRGLVSVFDPDALRDGAAAVRAIEQRVAAWPSWTRGAFTLKPRLGAIGRGRVAGRDGRADTPQLRGALPRLAARGGALLEPWLVRERDYSTQLWIDPGGELVLLGTTEQVVSDSGVWRGNRGTIDHRGRVGSGAACDADLRESAVAVARAAAAAGFHGPCGVDAFRFAGPDGRIALRGVVELNARFTTGTIAIGLLRRALRAIRRRLPLKPGELARFHFALAPPGDAWPASERGESLLLPLGRGPERNGPGLRLARGELRPGAELTV